MKAELQNLLHFGVENKASDLHLQTGSPPMLRIGGQMRSVKAESLSEADVMDFIAAIVPAPIEGDAHKAMMNGLDFSYSVPGLTRFRCSAFSQLGKPGIVLRIVRSQIPTIDDLHLPKVVADIALSRRGLTLVTGTTGSGKSTTLAAMIELINQNCQVKIITVEDPVEYVYTSQKALISQLEVGLDTPSFQQALRQALRQNPDVILIGELRNVDSLRMALQAADTGHQVFSTVHSSTAAQTVERIIAMFPPAEHALLLSQLAGSLESIISQRLLAMVKEGVRPAVEILRGNAVVQKFVRENQLKELNDYIERGEAGMQSFDQHILKMYHDDLITGREAMRWASHPESLAIAMHGIKTATR